MTDSILFDEAAYEKLSEVNKPVFIYDWLRTLEQKLPKESKQTIREVQEDLIQQLLSLLTQVPGHPTHNLIGRCLAKLFLAGDALLLYTAVNTCNGLLKCREDGPSSMNNRLAALNCLNSIYKTLGRLTGRSFEDSVLIMVKLIKQTESQVRYETMNTLCSLLEGVGSAASVCHKEIFKACKVCMTDRVSFVRTTAARCLYNLVDCSPSTYTNDLETTVSLCLRCMDGATYITRLEAARVLGHLLAKSQQKIFPGHLTGTNSASGTPTANANSAIANSMANKFKTVTLQDVLNLLASGFLKGPGGFLKATSASDMIKGTNSVNREVRIGVTYAYVEFIKELGPKWLETNLTTLLSHCATLLVNPRATPTHVEAICARQCIQYLFANVFRRLLSEQTQVVAARELIQLVNNRLQLVQGIEPKEEPSSDLSRVETTPEIDFKSSDLDATELDDNSAETTTSDVSKGIDLDMPFSMKRSGFGRPGTRNNREQQQQHLLVCLLDLLNQLLRWLDSLSFQLLEQPTQVVDVLCTALAHPLAPVRLASASCLRQLAISLPHQRVPLLNRCISCLQQAQRSNPDAILGYSYAIAALVASANASSSFSFSTSLSNQIFTLAEELLRAANQNSRLTLPRTQAGWILLGACMTLKPHVIRSHLPRMLLFWRNAFPRSMRELEAEKQRGDAFTWQVMLEARAGALCSMQCFLEYCSSYLLSDETMRRILPSIECALNMLAQLSDIVRIYGNHLKAIANFIRLRLYRVLLLLPPSAYTGTYSTLLRELVAEFTLTDNMANTTTSLLKSLCKSDDSVSAGFYAPETDQKILEDQLQPYSGNSPGALEHDTAYLFLQDGLSSSMVNDVVTSDWSTHEDEDASSTPFLSTESLIYNPMNFMDTNPSTLMRSCSSNSSSTPNQSNFHIHTSSPVPVNVAVIDASIELFGRLFPCVPIRHRTQMLEHFAECIRLTKSIRQEAVQINVFAALLSAMRHLAETKSPFGDDAALRKSAATLTFSALTSPSVLLRCAAGECLGRLAQVVAEPGFLAELAQRSFDLLRTVRNPTSRAGHCLSVGCLHRYVGGLVSGQHLSTSVGVLLAVAQDSSVPEVQVWALHALALVADSGGPIFREYVRPSLNLVLQLLLRSPGMVYEIQRSLGRLLAALITTLGPELRGSNQEAANARRSCLLCCVIMQDSSDPLLHAEAIACLQQLHMFAPMHVKLAGLVPHLQLCLSSPHLILRRTALACLRQLSQKEAEHLCQLTDSVTSESSPDEDILISAFNSSQKPHNRDPLELMLFSMLDVEIDAQLRRDIGDTLVGMVQCTGRLYLSRWLNSLKQVLQVSTTNVGFGNKTQSDASLDEFRSNPRDISNSNSVPNSNPASSVIAMKSSDPVSNSSGLQADMNARGDDNDDDVGGEEDAGINVNPTSSGQEDKFGGFKLLSRCSTRVLAINCIRMLISICAKLVSTTQNRLSTDSGKPDQSTGPMDSSFHANDLAHFDLAKARLLRKSTTSSEWLILHLSDLIKVAFMSATSECDKLRVDGLRLLFDVIRRFSPVPDPDFPDHSILEQYEAQVSAALRPVFIATPESTSPELGKSNPVGALVRYPSPELVAIACQVCSTWISSGVARDLEDLRRVNGLLYQAFKNLQLSVSGESNPKQQPEEDGLIEKLAILHAWSQVYIVTRFHGRCMKSMSMTNRLGRQDSDDVKLSMSDDDQFGDDLANEDEDEDEGDDGIGGDDLPSSDDEDVQFGNLMDFDRSGSSKSTLMRHSTKYHRRIYKLISGLVLPILPTLGQAWFQTLKQYALISLPDEFACAKPQDNSKPDNELIRFYYDQYWPGIAHAMSLWLPVELSSRTSENEEAHQELATEFSLVLGLCVEAMCNPTSKQSSSVINSCLRTLYCLLSRAKLRAHLFLHNSVDMALELLQMLHRLLLTRDAVDTHLLILSVVLSVLSAAEERLAKEREDWLAKDPSGDRTSMLISSEPLNDKFANVNMASSVMLQTTGLVDTGIYEHAEGGFLASFFNVLKESGDPTQLVSADSSPPHPLLAGLRPGRSIVFSCLEIVVCVLARYRPQMFTEIKTRILDKNGEQIFRSPTGKSNRSSASIPETPNSSNPNAPCVLSTALCCLSASVNLCAPKTLLSTLILTEPTNSYQQQHDSSKISVSDSIHNSALMSETGCLLPVLLELTTRTAQTVLLNQIAQYDNKQPQVGMKLSGKFNDGYSLPDFTNWLPTNGACDKPVNEADEDAITSSTTHNLSPHPAQNQRRAKQDLQCQIGNLIGWTSQQMLLAESVIDLISRLATHHYPILGASSIGICDVNQSVQLVTNGVTQPDSSTECELQSSIETAVESSDFGSRSPSNQKQVAASASAQWYELISESLVNLLRHEHSSDTKDTNQPVRSCCMASITLVCRICARCPMQVIKSSELLTVIISMICRVWRLSGLEFPIHPTGDKSSNPLDNPNIRPISTLVGLPNRRICLASIDLLINHKELPVRNLFIKTLAPQIFRWLFDLSILGQDTNHTMVPLELQSLRIAADQFKDCLHAAINLLESLLILAEHSSRQGLILILLPLLCSLLLPEPPSANQIVRAESFKYVNIRIPELYQLIHSIALKHIMSIALRYPTEFRAIFLNSGDLKPRLEAAIKQSSGVSTSHNLYFGSKFSDPNCSGDRTGAATSTNITTGSASIRSKIQLKTDFSDFV